MKPTSLMKRLALAAMLIAALLVLASCYVEPDDVDINNGNLGGQQTFEGISTPTPTPTATPEVQQVLTPTPTAATVDWNNWDFGNNSATNPPSSQTGSTPTPASQQSGGTATPTTGQSSSGGSVTATPKKTSSATPTPKATSTTLKLGSKGSAVKKMQQRLKDLGYLTGTVDGTFGADTETAVKAFQKNNGLTADGKAGTATLNKLYSSSAKKASSSSDGSTTGGTGTSNYTSGKTNIYLRLGDTGSNVKYMQNRLIELGYLSGTADGTFGETTEAAVMAFQKRNNLWHDGVAGPDTLQLMYSSSAKKATAVAGTLGSLSRGMNGAAVRSLQTNLKKLGYYSGSIDGDYGDGTFEAVVAFQAAHGLEADGVAGKATQNAIAAELNGGSSGGSGSGSSSSTSPENYGKTASSNGYSTISGQSGSSSSNIAALQSALSATGYYSGSVDGSYGTGTEDAVKAYQQAVGLRVTGLAGPSTQRLLYGGKSQSGTYTKLQLGDTGSKVKTLQYALYELKYYDGEISGTFDTLTENAVMEFQDQNGLEVDGVAGQDTQRRLYSSDAVPCR